jgi:hypothetical protein
VSVFCENCGKDLSPKAVACPNCGHPGPGAAVVAARTQTEGFAIASLICSIAGAMFMLPLVGGILGIVFAGVARDRMRRFGTEGESLARAGVIVGWIGLALNVVVFFSLCAVIASVDNVVDGPTYPGF